MIFSKNFANAIVFLINGLIGGLFTFFAANFLKNFYAATWQFVLLAVLLSFLSAWVLNILFNPEARFSELGKETLVAIFISLVFSALLITQTIYYAGKFPNLFRLPFLTLAPEQNIFFLALAISIQIILGMFFQKINPSPQKENWIKDNLPGLLLAASITLCAFTLATAFLRLEVNTIDDYFDTDSLPWINRISASMDELRIMRPVHPFAFIIFRPLAWALSFILNGDQFYTPIALNALFGGVCVLLVWLYFKQRTQNAIYAILIAGLLGLSNSHLLLSVFVESYIFSAAVLIALIYFMEKKNFSTIMVFLLGLLSFGITITNFAQACILYFLKFQKIISILRYVMVVLIASLLLGFIQARIYPTSMPFYLPNSYQSEQRYGFNIITAKSWDTAGRANVLTQSTYLFNIIAPRPKILIERFNCSPPCFASYFIYKEKYRIAEYLGLGNFLKIVWLFLLGVAGALTLEKIFKFPKDGALQIALLLNIFFNFILHMLYGDDPMLYSPDWTYAVVFLFGISYEDYAGKKIFQGILLIFLTGLLFNNMTLFHVMLNAISPFYK